MKPVNTNFGFRATERCIRNQEIPELQPPIASLALDTVLNNKTVNQVSVWNPTLAIE